MYRLKEYFWYWKFQIISRGKRDAEQVTVFPQILFYNWTCSMHKQFTEKRTHICCSHIKMWEISQKKHKHTRSGKKSGITYGWKKQNVNHWDICYTNSVPRIIFLPRQVYFRQFVYCIVQVCIQQPATQSSNEKQTPSILIENVNRAKIHWVNL